MASIRSNVEVFRNMAFKDWMTTGTMFIGVIGLMVAISWFGENIVGAKLMGLSQYQAHYGVDVSLVCLIGILISFLVARSVKDKLMSRKS